MDSRPEFLGTMNEDLENIQYASIWDYNYSQWFQTVQYNGKTLNAKEREEFIDIIDEEIALYESGLPMMYIRLNEIQDKNDDFHELERKIVSFIFFVTTTMADFMVASKYFLLANTEYDKRYMRGKLKVLLNEGFKKLYGYNEKNKKDSEWFKFLDTMKYFPEIINRQYQDLTYHLEMHSKSSSWWREERNLEIHLVDIKGLYESRSEDLNESKIMTESLRLFSTLLAVNAFLRNANGCSLNFLIKKYRKGELVDK